jgi:hypothetical protein
MPKAKRGTARTNWSSADADNRVSSHSPTGLDVDGRNTPLQGEPPIAQSKGWGDLSFLRSRGLHRGT